MRSIGTCKTPGCRTMVSILHPTSSFHNKRYCLAKHTHMHRVCRAPGDGDRCGGGHLQHSAPPTLCCGLSTQCRQSVRTKLITASAFSFKSISGGIGVCGRLSFVACSRWNKSEASRYQLSLCYHFDAGLPNLFVVSTQQTRPSNIPRSCSEAVVMVATTAPVLGDAGCRLAAVNTSSLYVVVG